MDFDIEDYDDDISLDDSSKGYLKRKDVWYKGEKNRTDRVAIVYFHPVEVNAVFHAVRTAKREGKTLSKEQMGAIAEKALASHAEKLGKTVGDLSGTDKLDLSDAKMKRFSAHYKQGLGYVVSRLGKDGPEADKSWNQLGEARDYFTTVLLVYPTDNEGQIDKESLTTKWKVLPWRYGPKTFELIWRAQQGLQGNNLSIADQDLLLTCKDAQYQNMEISLGGAAIWRKNDKFKQLVLEKALPIYDKLIPFRELTTDQLREKLGLSSAVSDVSGGDFSDVLDNI